MLKLVHFLTKTLLFVALFGLAYFLSDLATCGFTLARLRTSYNLSLPSEGAEPYLYLKQKFYLKAQGGQSYVFISADGKYVLKFFKDMPRPWLPLPSYQKKKIGKLKRTLKGYQLAFSRLREETGLPVHLWDERLATTEAHRHLYASGVAGSEHKKIVDQVAAVLIFQGYLDALRNSAETEEKVRN